MDLAKIPPVSRRLDYVLQALEDMQRCASTTFGTSRRSTSSAPVSTCPRFRPSSGTRYAARLAAATAETWALLAAQETLRAPDTLLERLAEALIVLASVDVLILDRGLQKLPLPAEDATSAPSTAEEYGRPLSEYGLLLRKEIA